MTIQSGERECQALYTVNFRNSCFGSPRVGPWAYAPTVQIHAASRPADDTTAEAHRWTVETDDYEAGMAEVRMAIPEGWVLLHVTVDR